MASAAGCRRRSRPDGAWMPSDGGRPGPARATPVRAIPATTTSPSRTTSGRRAHRSGLVTATSGPRLTHAREYLTLPDGRGRQVAWRAISVASAGSGALGTINAAYVLYAVGMTPVPELKAPTRAQVEAVKGAMLPWSASRDRHSRGHSLQRRAFPVRSSDRALAVAPERASRDPLVAPVACRRVASLGMAVRHGVTASTAAWTLR